MLGNISFIITLICFVIGIAFIVNNLKKRKIDNGKMWLLVMCCIVSAIMMTAATSLNQCASAIEILTYELDQDFYKDEKSRQEKNAELQEAKKGIKVAIAGIAITLSSLCIIEVAQNRAVIKKEAELRAENALHAKWDFKELNK
ncbi:hypothetical protein SAMN02745248_02767 [Hathewaya proteolytica DSM 3090]|uniref:Uncharacterized protein n=1 Tax=Hathewaya proteolytica DSM 3090 TaxID=1121331 RepID=A0A1M6T9Z5_9CLOT|nr:hypothetical protein [Hathewaya proteolytica]SHK53835.1 hypothetical protein SAMN02745248_02767 [Hathewaya proteolytica DSM 3090]